MRLASEWRQGLHLFRVRPFFAAVIVITLGLGIAAATTVLSIAGAVLARPLPFTDPASLVMMWESQKDSAANFYLTSWPNFLDWKERTHSFSGMAISKLWEPLLTTAGEPTRLKGAAVSGDFFAVLGVRPMLGRPLLPQDEGAAAPVVVLSHRIWQTRFGGDREILGKTLRLDDKLYTVVGILPPNVVLSEPIVFQTIDALRAQTASEQNSKRGNRYFRVVARLRRGVGLDRAAMEMRGVGRQLAVEYPDANTGRSVEVRPVSELMFGDVRPALLILLGAVALVLLVMCTNLTNMLLVRATTRRKELALQASLGASPARLARQMLLEGLPLLILGVALAVVLTFWLWSTFAGLIPPEVAQLLSVRLDTPVILIGLLLSLLTFLIIETAPIAEVLRTDIASTLKEGGGSLGESPATKRLRNTLVIGQVAFSFMLLVGAGLMLKSLLRLSAVELGFRPEHVLTASVELPASYESTPAVQAFYRQVLQRVGSLRGVGAVALINNLPFKGGNMTTTIKPAQAGNTPEADRKADLRGISLGYLSAMGITMIKGRTFLAGEDREDSAVLILNAAAAEQLWPHEEAIGKRVILGWGEPIPREVVGVAADVRHESLEAPPRPEIYLPYIQVPYWSVTLVVRTLGDPVWRARDVKTAIRGVDRNIVIGSMAPMSALVSSTIARPRLYGVVLLSFAVVSLFLAVLGVYGVIAFAVSQRLGEFAIRMALGAQKWSIVRMVMTRGLALTIAGAALGFLGALTLSKLLASVLFEVGARDPWVFCAVLLFVISSAVLGSYVAARRAAEVNVAEGLRRGTEAAGAQSR